MSMPFPLFAKACFDPEATKLMGDVFEEIILSLDRVGRPRVVQEAIARQISALLSVIVKSSVPRGE